jgi:hypothetical protein
MKVTSAVDQAMHDQPATSKVHLQSGTSKVRSEIQDDRIDSGYLESDWDKGTFEGRVWDLFPESLRPTETHVYVQTKEGLS